jgi:predicted acetyltransferase
VERAARAGDRTSDRKAERRRNRDRPPAPQAVGDCHCPNAEQNEAHSSNVRALHRTGNVLQSFAGGTAPGGTFGGWLNDAMDVRLCRDLDDFRGAANCIGHYFGHEWDEESAQRFVRNMPVERTHAAFDGGRIVGGAGVFPFGMTVPGGELPVAGVSVVGVLPTHRRRGILTALMRAQLDDVYRRGEPLAMLWASEAPIYGRYGYGMASLAGDVELGLDRAQFARPFAPLGSPRLLTSDESLDVLPPLYDRIRPERPGMIARSRDWWELRRLNEADWSRRGAGPLNRVVLEVDGEPLAYALYRIKFTWEGGENTSEVRVIEALGATPEATAGIWRYLLDIDWMPTLTAGLLPVDHPLFHLLAEPGRMRFRVADALWCRLVDVEAALAGRSYAGAGEVVLEVADAFCPWNEGHWLVGAHGAERTESPGELALDATALGSVYFGGFTFEQLSAAGRVQELEPGAVERADDLFRTPRAPWCPEIF